MLAVITGGSRGIGAGITEGLLEIGYDCLIVSRSSNDFVDNMKEKYPNKVDFFSCDISNIDTINALGSYIKENYGSVELLVNDAGTAPKVRKDMLEITPEDFDFLMDINLRGTYFMSQVIAKLMVEKQNGRIVNIGSMSAYTASIQRAEYCVSKAGISMITKTFAARLAKEGIGVFEVRPGIIETEMTSGVKAMYEEKIANGLTLINRMGKPSDIAKCVVTIAQGNLDFCTGTIIEADGGFSVRTL